ncbi:MAG: TetR/AcrR family transcriptional regulator [Coriobacteriales bacterium]|nr:TetR/AcrR family transcriptional regulator [Coriobacteriales bacterium]
MDLLKDERDDLVRMRILDITDRLMLETSLDRLSVTEICKAAGLSRQTFYAHFRDKYAIAQWYWELLGQRFLRETGRTLDWFEGNYYMLQAFSKRATFFANSLKSNDFNGIKKYGNRRRREYLAETVVDYLGLTLTPSLAYQIDFFVDAESRAVTTWMKRGMPQSLEELCRFLADCVPPQLYSLLDIRNNA